MAAKVKLDVRWDPGFLERAEGIAEGVGCSTAEVIRTAAALGLADTAEVLRGKLAPGSAAPRTTAAGHPAGRSTGGGAALAADVLAAHRPAANVSDGGGIVPAAVATPASRGDGAGADSPVAAPAPAPLPARSREQMAQMRLDVAVARIIARDAGRGQHAPSDLAAARQRIKAGRVRVATEVVKDPVALVDPTTVGAS